jgi:hypothetical protein
MKTLYVAREEGTTEKQIAELIKDTIFETWPNDSMAIEKTVMGLTLKNITIYILPSFFTIYYSLFLIFFLL